MLHLIETPCADPGPKKRCFRMTVDDGHLSVILEEEHFGWHLSIGGYTAGVRLPTDEEMAHVSAFLLPGVTMYEHEHAVNPFVRHWISVKP